jgi:magnesium chelatase family protein
MSSKVYSAALIGLDAQTIEVEADISFGLPGFAIVGLPDAAVQESRDRVRSAIKNSGGIFPEVKITVNLAPADIKKEGPAYDLPIAVAILQAGGQLSFDAEGKIFVGELALNGKLRHVNGIISIALACQKKKIKTLFLPKINASEANLIPGIDIVPVESLSDLVSHLRGEKIIPKYFSPKQNLFVKKEEEKSPYDMAYIKGQEHAKRAMEIASAGSHNLLMSGPPGSGKTLLARTMPMILPEMSLDEALEVTKIYSIAGLLPKDKPIILERPFRSPHHTASGVSLVGGGTFPRPGEISLAHRGVLFLDELPEFDRKVLENLRQPLEDSIIQISRAQQTLTFPAKFTLIASMNPCPCGFFQDRERECRCTPSEIARYQKKISGPLLDRIDLYIEVPKVKYEKLISKSEAESSRKIQERIQKARGIQEKRFEGLLITTNSEMGIKEIKKFCKIDEKSQKLLKIAVNQMHLSARGFNRVLKLSRTIADLAGKDSINSEHIAEAIQYRPKQVE